MKNSPFFDIVFIIAGAVIFSLIDYFGYAEILSKYAVIVAMISYFTGKYIGRVELWEKLKRDRSN
jgi:hypothetical protein